MTIFVSRFFTMVIVAALFAFAPVNIATAQTAPAAGTAASRLRLIAEEPQPTVTTRTTAPYPATQTAPGAINTDNPPPPLPAGIAPEPSSGIAPRRNIDPTVPDAAIRQFMDEPRNEGPSQTPSFPEIRLRARIITEGKPPTALIEIGGPATRAQSTPSAETPGGPRRQVYQPQSGRPSGVFRTIREGDEFVLPQGDGTSPIRVVKLTGDEVIIEVVNRKAMIRLD